MDDILDSYHRAMADPIRRRMLAHMCCVWQTVNDLVDALGGTVKQPTVSHHLKVLLEAKLVTVRQEGRQRWYTLNQQQMTACYNASFAIYMPNFVMNIVPVADIAIDDIAVLD